jgi:3-deoxy-D-manno-octulosonic-acid transferase
LERVPEVEAQLKRQKCQWVRRSQGRSAEDADVLLLDTLGELRTFYALACDSGAAWVGGSFKDFGGQNPLEPAALGVPVFFGPHMRHFPEVAQALIDAGGARQMEAGELAEATLALLKDAKARTAQAKAASACVRQRSGASRRTADLALKLLLVARMRREGQDWREEGKEQFRRVTEFGAAAGEGAWQPEANEAVASPREFGNLPEGGDGLG